jgi:peptidoglycan/LPS O-acetylase OafA/YrhL
MTSLAQLLGILLIVAGALYRDHAPWPMWGGLLYVPGSTLLVFGLAGGGLLATHLSRPWLHRLGCASFSF